MAAQSSAAPHGAAQRTRRMLRENGLSLTLLAVFLALLGAQVLTGRQELNDERSGHGRPPLTVGEYLRTGHFVEATTENWESEFLQMAAYVLLTVMLYQKGSSESKDPDGREAVDRDPRMATGNALEAAPWPVRRGGWILRVYENSLSLAFLLMFLVSFAGHALGGARAYSEDQIAHGGPAVTVVGYLQTSRFWFESFQNWQSEFLAIAAMVLLSIHLRQRGSPESKPVDAPHAQTGIG
jgi:hypothetical protein